MKKLLNDFENKDPEIVITWHDNQTEAKGWLVINSLKGGAAGGGTRMKKGIDVQEVIQLAKTMEIKFAVSGPNIGGAKSGIDFDPFDKRKEGVLKRWYKAILPMLKNVYGTGGDLNVDYIKEVTPITESAGLKHPQEGIVIGHYGHKDVNERLENLKAGTTKIVRDPAYSPNETSTYTIADLISGYSTAESVVQYYKVFGGDHKEKKAIIQGWGNVGSSAGYYLSKSGVKIVGIMDRDGGVINEDGFSTSEIREFAVNHKSLKFGDYALISPKEMHRKFWSLPVDVFLPCAASKLVTRENVESLADSGVELISCGANVPFSDRENLFGKIAEYADNKMSVIPDFIANCGMARVFAYLMKNDAVVSDEAIFKDVSGRIYNALSVACDNACSPLQITQRVLKGAINQSLGHN